MCYHRRAKRKEAAKTAEKRFITPSGPVSDAAFSEDFGKADRFDKLSVGALGVYYRDGFRIRCIPYADMQRAFIRIHEVNGRMCCGKAVFSYYRMVFVAGGKEYADVMSEDEKLMDAALAAVAERSPHTAIGVGRGGENDADNN